MIRLFAVRLVHSAAIVVLVVTFTFVLIHLAPGNPLASGDEFPVPAEVRAQLRRNFGLDRPLLEQYVRYVTRVLTGDLGYSFAEQRPVRDAIGERVANTLILATSGLVVMFGVGVAVGAIQGARPGSARDRTLSVVTLLLYSTPVFWLGLVFLLVFAETLGWLPSGGALDPVRYTHLSVVGRLANRLAHLALPALTLGLVGAAIAARYQRSALLEVVGQDFVRAARAKGLTERVVLLRHALRNALLPTITLFGLAFPVLLSGAVLVETVFAWPGLGKFAVDSIARRDYYVVTASGILSAVMVVVGNVLADLLYRLADPRTRRAA